MLDVFDALYKAHASWEAWAVAIVVLLILIAICIAVGAEVDDIL